MAENSINILMVGARRAGKTSALAGLVDTFKNGEICSLINVEDVTPVAESHTSLSKKIAALKDFIVQKQGRLILSEEGQTNSYCDYTLKVSLPNNDGDMSIRFTDANGEFYADLRKSEELIEKVQHYDIFIVAIDTPYLMESVNHDNNLCTKTINEAYNQVDNLQTLFSKINDVDGRLARMVLFVPIKCERWAKRGEIDKVTQRVEEVYGTHIANLSLFQNIRIAVVPIQTVGSIEFDSHKEAKLLTDDKGKTLRCSIENDTALFGNGENREILPSDNIKDDGDAVIEGYSFLKRPNSWFRVTSSRYEPHNCEQLAYFILHFLLVKTVNAKQTEQQERSSGLRRIGRYALYGVLAVTGHWWILAGLIGYNQLKKRMGTIKIEKLQDAINQVQQKGLWLTNKEGIKIINKGLL